MYCLISSVVGGVKVRPPLGDLGRALFSKALLVLRGHPGVAPWLSHEGITKFEGGARSRAFATRRGPAAELIYTRVPFPRNGLLDD